MNRLLLVLAVAVLLAAVSAKGFGGKFGKKGKKAGGKGQHDEVRIERRLVTVVSSFTLPLEKAPSAARIRFKMIF